MPQPCRVCHHPDRDSIEKAIVSQVPNRQISELHGVSGDSIRRHAKKHLPAVLVKAAEIETVAAADDLLAQAQRLQEEAMSVLEYAKRDGNPGGVLQAIDRLQKGVALLVGLMERMPAEQQPQTVADLMVKAEEGRDLTVRWQYCPHHPEGCPTEPTIPS